MSSPQVENGWVQLATELVDVVARMPLAGREFNVVIFIIRKTYGWKKNEDYISLSQFEHGTGIDRTSICRILKKLVKKNIIKKSQSVYALNKNYETWLVAPRPLGGSGVEANRVVAYTPHTKETITKEILSERASRDSEVITKSTGRPLDNQRTAQVKLREVNNLSERALRDSEVLTKSTKKNMRTYDEDRHFDEPAIDADSGDLIAPKKKSSAKWPDAQKVFDLFSNPARSFWKVRPVERLAAQTLFDMYGLEKLQTRINTIEKYKDDPECPVITSPSELLSKMDRMEKFVKRVHG